MPPLGQRRNAQGTFGLRGAWRKASMPSAGLKVPPAHGTWRPQARTICTLWKAGLRWRTTEAYGRQCLRDPSPLLGGRLQTLALARGLCAADNEQGKCERERLSRCGASTPNYLKLIGRITTKLSDGEMTYQHAGAPALVW